ncbi:hypothetical protein Cni_G14201 [Canna indica]|uniref:Uncharacterized protein n=1 Tax=Canna indica TaxID=4628 RepID=A0AAQ3KBR3_9LILI|nr:hypothetical protein Cni_G14201 [Canna indica]
MISSRRHLATRDTWTLEFFGKLRGNFGELKQALALHHFIFLPHTRTALPSPSMARMVADGFAKHLLRRRSSAASSSSAAAQQSPLFSRRVHGTNSEAIRPGTSSVLPDEVIDVKSTVVTVVPDEVSRTKSGVVTVVPEDAIHGRPENYWTPDSETGVFIPDQEHNDGDSTADDGARVAVAGGSPPSVLDQTVWIRHLEAEEVDKPNTDL